MSSRPSGYAATDRAGRRSLLIKLGVLLVVILVLIGVWQVLPIADLVAGLQERVATLGPLGYLVFALVYVLSTLVMGPALLLSLSAGLLWGPVTGLVAVLVSATLAAVVAALVGRYLAHDRVQAFVARDLRLQAVVRAVAEGSWRVVLLLRLSPLVPFGIQNYLLSVTGITLLPYTLATLVGILPSSAFYVYLGSLGGELSEAGPLRWVLLGVGLLASVLVTVIVARRAKAALEVMLGEPLDDAV